MNKICLSLLMFVSTGAFAGEFAAEIVCSEGTVGKADYKEIKVISALPIEDSMDVGMKLEVIITENFKLGKRRVTSIITPLKGEVIADTRPTMRPDPATIIKLIGENESGQNEYGTLLARENLASPKSMEMNANHGENLKINCRQ